jgi:hypothetical protein
MDDTNLLLGDSMTTAATLQNARKAIKTKGKSMSDKPKPKINETFKAFMPPLTQDEYDRLEQNIKEEGCREPLVIWRQTDEIVDGMNRFEICEKNDVAYKVVFLNFENEEQALDWIADNQAGRRNLTHQQRIYFLGREYRKSVGTRGGAQSEERENVAEKLAEEKGVSVQTVIGANRYAAAVDRIAEFEPEARTKLMSGEDRPSVQDVLAIARQPDNVVKIAAKKLAKGQTIEQVREHIPEITPARQKPPFDDAKVEDWLSKMARMFTARARETKTKDTDEFKAADEALEVLLKAWKKWTKITT